MSEPLHSDLSSPTSAPGPVAEIVGEVLGVPAETVAPSARLIDDLGVDSLAMIEIVIGVEQRLGVRIPDGEVAALATVAEISSYAEKATADS